MKRTLCLLLAVAALPAFAAGAKYAKPADYRQPIPLNDAEATHVRQEMRVFLSSVQKILTGAAYNDMKVVAEAATEAGMAAAHQVPPALREKLPLEFKKLGHATHEGFDELARDAGAMADPALALKQLSGVMTQCVSCHATFRIAPAGRTP